MGLLIFILTICCFLPNAKATLSWPIQQKRSVNDPLTNLYGQTTSGYYISIEIGTPAQTFEVVVDTGSSNLAIAGTSELPTTKFYNSSASATADYTNSIHVETKYTEGSWDGTLLYDAVDIPSDILVVKPVQMPVTKITKAKNFFIDKSNWQGILGLGYSPLVQPFGHNIPSVVELIISEAKLNDMFTLQLCASQLDDSTYGSLIFSGHDARVNTSEVLWTNIVKEWYYEVVITQIVVGGTIVDVPCSALNNDKTIVDSGTTNLRLPTPVYHKVLSLIKEYVKPHAFDDSFYNASKVYCTASNEYLDDIFPPMQFSLPSSSGKTTIVLTIYPSSYLQLVDEKAEGTLACYKFVIYPSETGTVLGTVIMQQYYVFFDRGNKKIGFVKTTCSEIPSNSTVIEEISEWTDPSTCCPSPKQSATSIVIFVLLGIVAFLSVLICLVYMKYGQKKLASCNPCCCCKEQSRYSFLNNL